MDSRRYLTISRPRFWIYLLWPYLIGVIASFHTDIFTSVTFWIGFLYFLFPANMLVYGANDISDYQTDQYNQKKQWYEALVLPKQHRKLAYVILMTNIPFLVYFLRIQPHVRAWRVAFIVLGVGYSLKPLRFKSIPFLDSISNSFYIFPGVIGYMLAGGEILNRYAILGACARAMAMHAYSAVPDIEADKKAWLPTIATVLGKKGTLIICMILYAFSAWIWAYNILPIVGLRWLVYVVLMLISLYARNVFEWYKLFPRINAIIGAIVFRCILYTKYRYILMQLGLPY